MTSAAKDPIRSGRPRPVDELSEDLDVAIREFLERNPHTSPHRIRQALSLVERRVASSLARRLAPALAVLAALVAGVLLGSLLG